MTMQHDAEQSERCLMLWARILRQSFEDLIALCSGDSLLSDNGRTMPAAERAETLAEVTSWFLNPTSGPVSLVSVCDHLDLNPGWMRTRAKQILKGSQAIQLRRRRLTDAQRAEICAMLARGDSTTTCAKRFNIDPSTCRKVRIMKRRAEMKNASNIAAAGVLRGRLS